MGALAVSGGGVFIFVPSVLTAVPLIKARRALHIAVYLENYTCAMYSSVQLEPTRVTQEGVNTGAIIFFLCFFSAPPSSCGACLHFLSREGFGRPCPSSTPKSNFVYSRSFSAILCIALHYYQAKVRKKKHSRRYPNPDLVARKLRGYHLDHRGDLVVKSAAGIWKRSPLMSRSNRRLPYFARWCRSACRFCRCFMVPYRRCPGLCRRGCNRALCTRALK